MFRFRHSALLLVLTLHGCAPTPPAQNPPQTSISRATPQTTVVAAPKASPILAPMLQTAQAQSDLPLRLPAPALFPSLNSPRVAELKAKIAKYQLFSAYRELAQTYARAGVYAQAAKTYRQEAAIYRRKGLIDASIIGEQTASRYDTKTQLFIERPATKSELKSLYSDAPLEPLVGAYLGAFIDRDDTLTDKFQGETFQTHASPEEFARVVGKPHGSLWMYLRYGQPFPTRWMERLKENNIIPHIAWEPLDLKAVRDDKYLQTFAQACRDYDWPIFFRFASEMNGKWTPYHGNPALYREKFALVHRVLHQYAPRIATIWCVNNPPLGNIDAYYPGDANVDWVGVNFYLVPFAENRLDKPNFEASPLALLDPIYQKYARRKPIAICEFAASHRARVDMKLRNDFAIQKMAMLYGALPRLYPRVKLVDWFDMNTIAHPTPGKTLNDYTLTDQSQVLAAYKRQIAAPYFLSQWQTIASALPSLPRPVGKTVKVRGVAKMSVWCNYQLTGAKTFARLGTKIVYASARPGAHEINLDLGKGPFGKQTFTVFVYDDRNRFVAQTSTILDIAR